jgi:phosphatidylinositol-3-phosphatase
MRATTKRSRGRQRSFIYLGMFAAGFVATAAVVPLALSASTTPANTPHVMIVMMENESASSVIGNNQMPFTNSLATDYGYATQSFAMAHPSLPNYLDIVSGSNQGVTQDQPPSSGSFPNAPTIANQLESAGLTVGAYAENLPADPSNDGGAPDSDGDPIYAVRHAPLGTGYFPHDGVTIKDASTLTSDLNAASAPDFVFFTPNMIDDGHDGTPAQADSFLSSFIPEVQATSWYADGGSVIVEWDEGADSDTSGIGGGDGGHVATIVVSAALKAHPQQDTTPVDTTGILNSIEDQYGVPDLGGSTSDGDIDALLSPAPAPVPAPAPTPAPVPKPVPVLPAVPKPAVPAPTSLLPAPLSVSASSLHALSGTAAHSATPQATVPSTPSSAATASGTIAPSGATAASGASGAPWSKLVSPPGHSSAPRATQGSGASTPDSLRLANALRSAGSGILTLVGAFVVGTLLFCLAGLVVRDRRKTRGMHSRPRQVRAPAPVVG